MWVIRFASLIFLGAGLSIAVAAQDVRTDHGKNAVFERYHTYSWGKVQTENPLWQTRITDAVDRALSEKRWQKVRNGGGVMVIDVGATQKEQEFQTFYNGIGEWRWGSFGETTTTVENYRVGTLVVDLYDESNKHLIWRGSASETLSKDPEHNEKNLDKAVDKIFKKFPPQPKK